MAWPRSDWRGRALVAVLLFLVLLVTTSEAGGPHQFARLKQRNIVPGKYTPIRSSCTIDEECAAGYICTQDGICGDPSPFLPKLTLWNARLPFATFLGLAIGLFVIYCVRDLHDWYQEDLHSIDLCMLSGGYHVCKILFLGGFLSLLIIVPLLTVKIPWTPVHAGTGANCTHLADFACAPYFCDMKAEKCYTGCIFDAECADGYVCTGATVVDANEATNFTSVTVLRGQTFIQGLCEAKSLAKGQGEGKHNGVGGGLVQTKNRFSVAVSILIATGAMLGCCCCGGCCIYLMDVSGDLCSMCACWNCLCGVGLFVGIYFVCRATPGHAVDAGVPCVVDAMCGPYTCDLVQKACVTSCSSKADCQGDYKCIKGECVLPFKYTGRYRSMSIVGAVGIGLAVFICSLCCMLCFGSRTLENIGPGWAAMWCLVSIAGVLLLVFSVRAVGANDPSENSEGTACAMVEAPVCYPYFCNVDTNQCNGGCEDDFDCVESTVCTNGQCVGNSDYVVPHTRVPGWLAWPLILAIATAFFLLVSCCLLCVFKIKFVGLPANADFDRALQTLSGVFGVTFWVVVALMLVFFIPSYAAKYQPSIEAPSSNGTACSGQLDPVCEPYLCVTAGPVSVSKSLCATQCTSDADCAAGAYCDLYSEKCFEDLVRTVAPGAYNTLFAILSCVGAVVISCLYCGRVLGGCSCFAPGFGVAFEKRPIVVVTGALLSAVAVYLIAAVFVHYESPLTAHTEHGAATFIDLFSNTTCAYLYDAQCLPYACQTEFGVCYGGCTNSYMCAPGTLCTEEKKCELDTYVDAKRAAKLTAIALAIFVGVCFVCPVIIGALARCHYARVEAYIRAKEEEEQERARLIAEAKRNHKQIINIVPYFSSNPTVITPGPLSADFPDVEENGGAGNGGGGGGRGIMGGMMAALNSRTGRIQGGNTRPSAPPDASTPLLATAPGTATKAKPQPSTTKGKKEAEPAAELPPWISKLNPGQWACSLCTTINDAKARTCTTCETGTKEHGYSGVNLVNFLAQNVGSAAESSSASRVASDPSLTEYVETETEEERAAAAAAALQAAEAAGAAGTGKGKAAAGAPPKAPTTTPLCCICYTEASTVRLAGRQCSHGFCTECVQNAMRTMVEVGQFPAQCPGCRSTHVTGPGGGATIQGAVIEKGLISADVIEGLAVRRILDADFARRFVNMMILRAFAPNTVISCPVCGLLNALPENMDKPVGWFGGTRSYSVECTECNFAFCSRCNVLYRGHEGLSCEAFAKKMVKDSELAAVVAINRTSKRCPNCKAPSFRGRGHACHHIMPGSGCVNCGYHWCYACADEHGRAAPYPCQNSSRHGLFCDERCDCKPCPDCSPGRPCPNCPGTDSCPSCHPR